MSIRVLLAGPNPNSLDLQRILLDASTNLVCFLVESSSVASVEALWARVDADLDDVILLDWHLVEAQTPDLVRAILQSKPRLRIVALLPQGYRQYRQACLGSRRLQQYPSGAHGPGVVIQHLVRDAPRHAARAEPAANNSELTSAAHRLRHIQPSEKDLGQ